MTTFDTISIHTNPRTYVGTYIQFIYNIQYTLYNGDYYIILLCAKSLSEINDLSISKPFEFMEIHEVQTANDEHSSFSTIGYFYVI